MSRKSQKIKIEEYIARKAEDRREKERIENSQDYQPEIDGYKPDLK